MIPFGQFQLMLKKENEGAVIMVNKILFKELINLIQNKKNSVTFKGTIALVINLSAYLYELKRVLGDNYEEMIMKLEETRVFRLFLLRLLIDDHKYNSTAKVHGIETEGKSQPKYQEDKSKALPSINSKTDKALMEKTENNLSPFAQEIVESLMESKNTYSFNKPKSFSLINIVNKIPFFNLTM